MRFLSSLIFLLACQGGFAAIERYDFKDEVERLRYQQLTEELRCPKCENQNLAGSDSAIAADLRREVHRLLEEGKSNEAVIDFMRTRYGDFVLYDPPFKPATWVLWLGPLLLIALTLFLLGLSRARRQAMAQDTIDADIAIVGKPCEQEKPSGLTPFSLPKAVSSAVIVVLLVGLMGGAWLLYRQIGGARAVHITELAATVYSGELPPSALAQAQQQLLLELNAELQDKPEQQDFLYLRARLLTEMGLLSKAAEDYRSLLLRFPEQDNLLSEYAHVLFLKHQNRLNANSEGLLKRALLINPANVTALGLLGMRAFEKGDYTQAVLYWNTLLQGLPVGSAQYESIAGGIARAQEKISKMPVIIERYPTDTPSVKTAVHVKLTDKLNASPNETVFVLLKAVNGLAMPLAAVKTTVAALAQPVVLDTALSPMRTQVNWSGIKEVEVIVRLSRSGAPQASPGDWQGRSAAFNATEVPASVSITLDQPVR